MASSSSSSSSTKPLHDVFLSFRGEDTRDNFTSHFYSALSRAKIPTFIDNNLNRGEEISPSLLKAIEASKLSVIIFSENYASSKWCLDELAKILECRKMNGQIVILVFYRVDPKHVRDQTDRFKDAFDKHEERFKENMDKVQHWRAALKEAGNLVGWDSKVTRPETELIEKIVRDILTKLNKMAPSYTTGLIGIDSHIEKVESLLCVESLDVRIVGIWGMGGIGKTTVAECVYNRICTQFDGFHFLPNVRQQLEERCIVHDLRNRMLSKLLYEETLNVDSLNLRIDFMMGQLRRQKVLIVLDDVDDFTVWEKLFGEQRNNIFGPGSRVLVTSRDRQVLKYVANETYEVKGLEHSEALQLFSLHAFKENYPPSDRMELSEKVVNYAKGNPLALKVLGCALFDRSKKDWDSALGRLGKFPHRKIQEVLRISYDALDIEQQKVFLDIACFFREEDRNRVTEILDSCYTSAHSDISTLIDKSLIVVFGNKLKMHDLLQEMGQSIVCEAELGERSRLWHPDDVNKVLVKKRKKGIKVIESISLDMSKAREMRLESDAFVGMDSLRLLKFHMGALCYQNKVQLPDGLKYLPDELTYLHWHGFPLKSLPSKFSPENLVELKLPGCKVKELWTGVQDPVNLRRLDLSHSKHLATIPDLSKAEKIESIILVRCVSLVELHPSIQYLNNLKYLNLQGCDNLRDLPSRIESKVLEYLNLANCLKVKSCPEISGNLEYVYLSETAIEELPQSIEKSKLLKILRLTHCSNITKFPEVSTSITVLHLTGTAIEEVPSSIHSFTRLTELDMCDCRELRSVPSNICELESLRVLLLSGCPKLESFPENPEPVESHNIQELYGMEHPNDLEELHLNICEELKELVPPECLKSLNRRDRYSSLHANTVTFKGFPPTFVLKLSGGKFETFPICINRSCKYSRIYIMDCEKLRSLPELPSNVQQLIATDCESLETISSIRKSRCSHLNFTNCLKLGEKAVGEIMAHICWRLHLWQTEEYPYVERFDYIFPGSEIPHWFRKHEQGMGSSVIVNGISNCNRLGGFLLCVVLAKGKRVRNVARKCRAKCPNNDDGKFPIGPRIYDVPIKCFLKSDHIWLGFVDFKQRHLDSSLGFSFEFSYYDLDERQYRSDGVKMCAVRPVYE